MIITVVGFIAVVAGSSLVLDDLPWFGRVGTVDRLAPYRTGRSRQRRSRRTADSVQQLLMPAAQALGSRVSRAAGVTEDLDRRLDRAGWSDDVGSFRLRELAHGVAALLATAAALLLLRPSALLSASALLAAPALAVLINEHLLAAACSRRTERLTAELPVIVEQLGLLISAGYSLPSALGRLAERSDGVVASELRVVLRRVRQGLSESAALAEMAERTGLDPVRRLVSVLRLHDATADLAPLISQEARSLRAEEHRALLEDIERRAQLVWVPVTVATLVPGLIFLAVPFISAMAQVTGGA